MASSDSQIDKSQRGRPKRAELPDVNINTGVQSINTESLSKNYTAFGGQILVLKGYKFGKPYLKQHLNNSY